MQMNYLVSVLLVLCTAMALKKGPLQGKYRTFRLFAEDAEI